MSDGTGGRRNTGCNLTTCPKVRPGSADRHEVWVATGDRVPSRIHTFARDYQCDSMVIIVQQGQGMLLQTEAIADLILNPPVPLVLLRLPEKQRQNYNGLIAALHRW